MGSPLSDEQKKKLDRIAKVAEPYTVDGEEMTTLDSGADPLRMAATIAKKFLNRDKSE